MEGRSITLQKMGKQLLDGLREMSPERVFAGIGVVTVSVFLVERAYNLYQSINKRNQLSASDLDTINKELEHIHILTGHAHSHQQSDALGTSLKMINDAIHAFQQLLKDKNAENHTAYRYELANLLCQRAQVQYLLGDLKKAENDLVSAISYNSSLITAHNFLAHLYSGGALQNVKLAKYYLNESEKLNREQVFVRLHRALAEVPVNFEELDICIQLYSQEFNKQPQRLPETLPSVIFPDLMVRCMSVFIANSNHLDAIQKHVLTMQALLQQNSLVVNKQLKFQLMESVLAARARMAELMHKGAALQEENYDVLAPDMKLRIDNDEDVGYLNNTNIVAHSVLNEVIRLQECDAYLLNPLCRSALTRIFNEFENRGYFKNTPALQRPVANLNEPLDDELAKAFVTFIKKQDTRLWFELVDHPDSAGGVTSLFNLACEHANINLNYFVSHQQNAVLQNAVVYNEEPNNTFRLLVNRQERKLQFILSLQTQAEMQRYLVVKGCEMMLLHFPDKQEAVNRLLYVVQFTNTRKPVGKVKQSSTALGFFSEHAVECLAVGGVALALGFAALKK